MGSVTLFVHSATARELQAMDRTHGGPVRSPFSQANKSSSSLEGMERPVRSFKSFIKTVPPHPQATHKPLPPTPSPKLPANLSEVKKKATPSPPVSTPPPASPARSASSTSWKAPTEWYEGVGTPPLPMNRTLSPLLPEPSPLISDMEKSSWLDMDPPPSSRLLPIYERPAIGAATDLGPPRTPPRTPLPAPPTIAGKSDEILITLKQEKSESDSPSPNAITRPVLDSDIRPATSLPVNSVHTSTTSSVSTNAKAFASLGIGSPPEQPRASESKVIETDSLYSPERTRPSREDPRSKKLRPLDNGIPLAGDNWEDTEMDERMRQLSVSQDYHDLLADQYRDINVHVEEPSTGGSYRAQQKQTERIKPSPMSKVKNHELVPRPLSWRKSDGSTPQIPSRNPSRNVSRSRSRNQSPAGPTEYNNGSLQEKVQKRISSWVPHRLSVGPRRSNLQASSSSPTKSKKKRRNSFGAKHEKAMRDDLRFSTFFPKGKPFKFRKPKAKAHSSKPLPSTSPSKSPPAALIRLPGGLAVVRHSLSPTQKSSSAQAPSPRSSHPSSHYTSTSPSNRTSDPEPRTSWPSSTNHRISDSPVAPGIAIRTPNTRTSTRSSACSHRSASSTSPTHPLAHELDPSPAVLTPPPSSSSNPAQSTKKSAPPPLPRPPPPPPSQSPSLPTPPLSPHAWTNLKGWGATSASHVDVPSKDDTVGSHFGKTSFIEKARRVRKKHREEVRHERLKRSIRVLGPTDPGVVGSYVRGVGGSRRENLVGVGAGKDRLPGYLVGKGA